MVSTTEISPKGKRIDAIHCLTIPLYEETAMLPNSAIAEVVSYSSPEVVENAPEWFLGYVNWRDYRVPLISFEAISGKEVKPAKKSSQIAVMNTLNGNTQVPYVAMLTQGIPSLAIVQEQSLEHKNTDNDERQSIAAIVDVGGAELLIPDIDDIEQRLMRLHF